MSTSTIYFTPKMVSKQEHYAKPAISIDDQIRLLKARGLIIENEDDAKHSLNNISYYHLSGYFKPFQNDDDTYIESTTFQNILDLYYFDRKLRLHFLNALERIEKSFKTQFVYQLSLAMGSHCLTDDSAFAKHKDKINKNLSESKEPFIKNFREKYSNAYPPLWILAEILSFGDILNIYNRSLDAQMKKKIADHYKLGWVYLYSWLENLREIRNICAHYSRLWNRIITRHLRQGEEYPQLQYNNHIFDAIIITKILLDTVSPTFEWLSEIKKLIEEYHVDVHKMGFPDNWEELFNSLPTTT